MWTPGPLGGLKTAEGVHAIFLLVVMVVAGGSQAPHKKAHKRACQEPYFAVRPALHKHRLEGAGCWKPPTFSVFPGPEQGNPAPLEPASLYFEACVLQPVCVPAWSSVVLGGVAVDCFGGSRAWPLVLPLLSPPPEPRHCRTE